MSFGEQVKGKADEVNLGGKAKDFGDALAEVFREAFDAIAGFADSNRDKVEGMLDKAQAKVSEHEGGKHTDTFLKVRAEVEKGFDKLAEQQAGKRVDSSQDKHSAWDDAVDKAADRAASTPSESDAPKAPTPKDVRESGAGDEGSAPA